MEVPICPHKKSRRQEISDAIKLLGWCAVAERLKTEEDKFIFTELNKEDNKRLDDQQDKILKDAGITL